MTYRGTIDEDKQIVLARPLSAMDKKLIRVAYVNPELRASAIRIVVADDSSKLKDFAKDRKWKNPETSNLIGFDRILELAGEDKIWAKAIVKKVTEEYKKSDTGKKENTKVEHNIAKRLQKDVEGEISKFKSSGKDITNPRDRAAFEEYLDEKLRPAQEEAYRKKIQEATGLVDEEYKKAAEGLLGKGVKRALSETFEDLGLSRLAALVKPPEIPNEVGTATVAVGAGLLSHVVASFVGGSSASAAVGATAAGGGLLSSIGSFALAVGGKAAAVVLSPFALGAAAVLSYSVYKKFKETPEGKKRDELLQKFNEKKEEVTKKIETEHKYKEIGKSESAISGMKEFYKDEKFEDDLLGDDLTIDELVKISEDDDSDPEDKQRAKKLLEEKKEDYMASKYTRQKTLLTETKGKKFKTPDGKRVTVKEMLDMEEEGDSWATDKLKDLRHSMEDIEEVKEEKKEEPKEEEELEFEDELFGNRQPDLNQIANITSQKELEKRIVNLSPAALTRLQEKLIEQAGSKKKPSYDYDEDEDEDEDEDDEYEDDRRSRSRSRSKPKPKKRPKKRPMRVEEDTPSISPSDAKVLLEAMGKIRKENESLESKFKNEKFKTPQDKSITFKTLKKKFSDTEDADHEWAVKTWEGLKKKMNKKGAEEKDQDKEIDSLVKEKFENALTVDPHIVEIFKEFTKDGKFDEEKFNEMLKGVKELSGMLKESKGKKASLDVSANRNILIKLAYNNPELRRDILKLLK